MYTGIIQTLAEVVEITPGPENLNFKVAVDKAFLGGVFIGASCSIDGVCFTVVSFKNNVLEFDAIKQTMDASTVGELCQGDFVHFERSLKYGEENGGHNISGHVHTKAELVKINQSCANYTLVFKVDKEWVKYLFDKGYVALQGASLTVSFVNEDESLFGVSLIPETLRKTNFGSLKVGDFQNIEVEQQTKTIVDSIDRALKRFKSL